MALILVVDGNDVMRVTLASTVRDMGHEAVEASDGKEAFDIVREQSVDLVITDYRMKRWSGLQLLSALRISKIATPVILCTGLTEKSLLTDLHEKEFEAVLIKDGHLNEALPEAIRRCIGHST